MEILVGTYLSKSKIRTVVVDFLALSVIYLLPTLSHLTGIPFYYLEPMRIVVLLSLMVTHRWNSLMLALTIPLFSFLIASHPAMFKVLLVTIDLTLNILLFLFFVKRLKETFVSVFLSIGISKIFYYLLKYTFIQFNLLDGDLVTTSLYIQIILMVLLSFVVALWGKQLKNKTNLS
ncbi:MAG: hypothetical protein GW805_12600 [Ignavibacteria bacterium]|nr:hypothetical protein [Ignavibacteria bacterium]NCS81241.1 hypothetical protein [Ignavibacteria bacterium]OIO20583.1 MAG: hypothetical protein AUJ54_05210 [Ignavibacteria bacterium CG1_02_37_35]PIS44591.1 MAG: hypothetical protein COT22_09715 [Ignavibacteria bacterium CG08_land_8_20_14_0_20_37_9]PIX94914.1 MAG: hypothetical protein COZ25_03120 [Ignavibacteria bacterium CG_4_10_14_3_um_filter_37_18]